MKKILLTLAVASLSLFGMSYAANNTQSVNLKSAIGYWKTFDEDSSKPASVVQIFKEKSGALGGRICHIYLTPTEHEGDRCTKCTGALKDHTIYGMQIIRDMSKIDNNEWAGGHILDPRNGKEYRSKFNLANKGQALDVRGYILLPLFGRSQTWKRTDAAACKTKYTHPAKAHA